MCSAVVGQDLLEEFTVFLEKKMGLYYPKNRLGDLEKRLLAITQSFEFSDVATCVQWLIKAPLTKEQIEILAEHLTIGETYFFRDEHFYAALEKEILPEIIKRHQNDRCIRIWSAACSTGEEPYSIAMLLHRLLLDLKDWDITLIGTDINAQFLQKARKGQYKKWSFRAIPEAIKERYFHKNSDDSYTVIPEIHRLVKFQSLNLVEDPYPDQMDLISCHNVLIYFSEGQIAKTIGQLSAALNDNGILSLAAIEVPFVAEKNLILQRYPKMICHKRGIQEEIPVKPKQVHPPKKKEIKFQPPKSHPAPILEKKKVTPKKTLYEECQHLYINKGYEEVAGKLSSFLMPFQKDPKTLQTYLHEVQLLIRTYANQGDFAKSIAWCEAALAADKLNPLTHYLHATVLQAEGQAVSAIKALKSALFIDPYFIMAHYMLGMLEKEQGNESAALQHIQVALKLIDEVPQEAHVPGTDESSEYLKNLMLHSL